MRTENPETERAKAANSYNIPIPLRSFSALATCRPALSSFNVELPFQRSVSKTFLSLSSSPSAARSLAALGGVGGFVGSAAAPRTGGGSHSCSLLTSRSLTALRPPFRRPESYRQPNRNPEGDTHSVCCEA